MARKKPLSHQVVVIGGGSYGLGRAIARATAGRGAKVVVGARNREALDNTVRELEAAGSEGLAVETDVADRPQVENLVERAVERFARIDTYVANAMVTVYAEAHRLEDDELRRVIDVNFLGGVYGYWAALPHLRDSRGTYLQIASALSYFEPRQKMGLQPQPIPPIYQPEPLSPRLGDLVLLRNGWSGRHTEELKPRDSPDNLFETMRGDPGAHGRFDDRSRESTAWTWLRLHGGKPALIALGGAALALGTMGIRTGR